LIIFCAAVTVTVLRHLHTLMQ